MGDSIQGAVDALKREVGIPGVNPAAGSPPVVGANVNLQREPVRPTPAQQADAVLALASAAPSEPAAAPEPAQPKTEEILAAKDKAIKDLQERNAAHEQASKQMSVRIAALEKPATTPPEPQLPEGFEAMLPHEKTKAMIALEADKLIRERLRVEREETGKKLTAISSRLEQATNVSRKLQAAEDERELRKQYPQLDLEKHKSAIERRRADLPGLSLPDAVRLVVSPSELATPAVVPPHTLASLPSGAAAAGGSRQAPHTAQPEGPSRQELLTAVGTYRSQGRSIEANALIDALVRRSVPAPQDLRRY